MRRLATGTLAAALALAAAVVPEDSDGERETPPPHGTPTAVTTRIDGAPRVTTIRTSEALVSRGRLGGVAVDRWGNIYVSNFGATVWRVSPDGTASILTRDLRGSSGNAVDSAGNLYQASFLDGRIVRIAPDGTARDLVEPGSGLDGPVGLAVVDDGAVMVCNCLANSISRVENGSISELASGGDLDCPNGITFGPAGELYIASFNNEHIVRVDSDGRVTRFATVPGGRNAHVAFAAGALWVTKIETHAVYRVAMDGRAERYAGTGTAGFDDGPVEHATLSHPNGIAATPDGRSLVVNTLDGEWRGEKDSRLVLRRIELSEAGIGLEPITLPVGDLSFDALAAGPEDGELVLLLHGFPQTGRAFEAQLRALGAAGYRAVAPDQRGYSPGARPAEVEAYAMGKLVTDVIGMADALGRERFHLVGHDWGGAVAWVTATRHPSRIRSLTVLSTPHFQAFTAELSDPDSEQSERSSYFSDFSAPGAEERFLADDGAFLRQLLSGVPESHREHYLARLGTPAALRAALNWYRASAPKPARAGQPPSDAPPPRIPPIRVPTLYIWGTEDGAFGRAAAEKTAEFVAGPFEFHALKGIGHWVPETAADTVNRLMIGHLRGGAGGSSADDGGGARGGALENYREARRILERALEALGGEVVLNVESLGANYAAVGLARGQSRRPGPPFDTTEASGAFLYETNGRLYHEERFVNEGGTDRSFRRALGGEASWNYWVARQLLTRIEPADVAFLRAQPQLNMEKAFPHTLVRAGLAKPVALRWLGASEEGGRRIARLSLAETDGEIATVGVDAETGYPVVAERLGSDRLAGDAVQGVQFDDYAVVDGLAVPRRLTFTLNGDTIRSWSLSDLRLNPPIRDELFAAPAGVAFAEHPRRFAPIEAAPGVHVVRLYSGPANSYNTVLVEMSDHVIVLEAPLVDAFNPVIRQIAAAVAPGKPIRAVVTTHHHHDHAGGVVSFLKQGVDVIAPPHAISVIEAMAAAPHTLAPTAKGKTTGRLLPVADSLVLSDGSRTVRLLQVGPTPHADQILIAHLPGERLLFVADLFAVPESRVFPPVNATVARFRELVDELDLAFDTVVPTHGVVGTWADLEAASSTR